MFNETINQPTNPEQSELNSLSKLFEEKDLDREYTFALENEKDENDKEIPGKAFWVKIEGEDNKTVEGKIYRPEQDSKTLIVFAPGMPGDGTTWFEDKHVSGLVEQGDTVLTVRHNGTRLDTENAMNYVHSQERIDKGLENGQTNLGEQRIYTLEETAREYETALKLLGNKFENIKLIGHSSGVPNLSYAITFLPKEIQDKITNFVGLAGFIGKPREGKDTFGHDNKEDLKEELLKKPKDLLKDRESIRRYYEICNGLLNLGDPDESVKDLEGMLNKVYGYEYPKNINYVLGRSSRDEYIPLPSAKDLQSHLGRGLMITELTSDSQGGEFHDLRALTPETLLKLLKVKTSQYPHHLIVDSAKKHDK